MKESIIQQQICDYLSAVGVFYFAVLNEAAIMILKMFHIPDVVSYRIVSFLKKMGLLPGIPDKLEWLKTTKYSKGSNYWEVYDEVEDALSKSLKKGPVTSELCNPED